MIPDERRSFTHHVGTYPTPPTRGRIFPAHFEVARDDRDDGNPLLAVIITIAFEAAIIGLAYLIWWLAS